MNKALLPVGFHDILYPQAHHEMNLAWQFSNYFASCGYKYISPPLLEFEESLFFGDGANLAAQSFRAMDPISNSMMAVRSDITVQIARIARTRLKNDGKPCRLSYWGPVLRSSSSYLHRSRQLNQAGFELLGINSEFADAEILITAIDILKQKNILDLTIDFSMPSLTKYLIASENLPPIQNAELINAIARKDSANIKKYSTVNTQLLLQLSEPYFAIDKLKSLKLPNDFSQLFVRLEKLINLLKISCGEVEISINPLEFVKSDYHTGLSFNIFSRQCNEEIAKGGRYIIISDDEKTTDAVGLTFYIENLANLVAIVPEPDKIMVPFLTLPQIIADLHSQNYAVLRNLSDDIELAKAAKHLGCTHILLNGKITKIST